MQKATDSIENAHYNDEVNFLDEMVEFHPGAFNALPSEDRRTLEMYYLLGMPTPENIFAYRNQLARQRPGIEAEARQVFQKILGALKIDSFRYTTEYHD